MGCDDGFLAPGSERRMNHKEVRKLLEAMNMFSDPACGNDLMSGHSCGMYEFALKKVYPIIYR